MRKPAQGNQKQSRVSIQEPIPAPTLGWNAKDPVAKMDPRFAILLDNFWPTPTDIMLRKGKDDHVTGVSGQVESLMVYNHPNGTEKMFGAAGTAFYDVTSAGAVGAAVVSGLNNARWYDTNFTTTAATYLIACNGVDNPRYWDSSAWVSVDGSSSPAITGVTTTKLVYPWVHKNRVYFVEKDSLTVWYLATDTVGGAATAFRLNGVAKKGGYIVAGATWTIDAGEGQDDHWVVVTSEGEVIVYKGTDISAASTWALVGVYNIGQPIGRRCLIKWGGDLLIITKEGVFPLSQALLTDRRSKVALTDNILDAMADAARQYADNFGWQLLHYPTAQMLILNVPVAEGSQQHQYAMNTNHGAWGRFKSWEANCWALFNGEPYFGGDGVVKKVWGVFEDDGSDITGNMKQAFSYFRAGGRKKDFKMVRPIFASNGSPAATMALNTDYSDTEPSSTITFTQTGSLWDSAVWDVGVWSGGLSVLKNWQSVAAEGVCAAPRVKVVGNGVEVRYQAADIVYEPGGIGS